MASPFSLSVPNVNLSSELNAQTTNSDFLPKLWKKGVQISEAQEDYFNDFEGGSQNSPIMSVTDLAKGAGQKITFRTMAQLFGDGVQGDDIVGSNVEEFRVGSYTLSVDYLRHAVSYNIRTEDQTGLMTELKSSIPNLLGNWLGRKKTERLLKMFIHKGNPENTVRPSNKATTNDLRSADVLTMDAITTFGQQMRTRGAKPAIVGKVGKNTVNAFTFISTGEGLVALRNSADYKQATRDAGVRGDENYIFKGGFANINGHVIRSYDPIDHDGWGPVGSPLNPKAYLGADLTTAPTASFSLKGGGSTTAGDKTAPKYFEFFSNYAYKWSPDDALSAGSGTKYVLIYNLTDGKYNLYSYTTNNGNLLTITGALKKTTDTASAYLLATVGAVSAHASTGVWADANLSRNHPVGSLIVECNSYGTPIGRTVVLGATSALRGYGRFTNERTEEMFDGAFIRKCYLTSIFGQTPFMRPDGKFPNYAVVEHAIAYAGLNLPVIA